MAKDNRKDSAPPQDVATRISGAANLAVLYADLDGTILGSNAWAASLFGEPEGKLRISNLADFKANIENASGHSRDLVAEVLQSGQCQARIRGAPKEGETIQLSIALLRDARSAPCGLVAFASLYQLAPSAETLPNGTSTFANREIDGVEFIVASPVMHKFMAMVERVAHHTETALITGETGAGKELIARSIHNASHRSSRPWVDINCAALPENLVESELFGYEKGAFSGADTSKPGLFELADKGTLFLDEIAELQIQTQVKLLRVLDGHSFYRLGGHRKINVDVRIVAATNQNLESAVQEGHFRQDLFHRLGQFCLRVPALRERPEDIVALAEHFLRLKTPVKSFTPDAISALLSHQWPGNVRELRNVVAKVAIESTGLQISAEAISCATGNELSALRQLPSVPLGNLENMEEQMIIRALERTGGHRARAAEDLGISRRTLSRKLKEYNISAASNEGAKNLGLMSQEQQKFFRARVEIPVLLRNPQGEETSVRGVNLSTGGMGLAGLKKPLHFGGLLDLNFTFPETDVLFSAKARVVWLGDGDRVGVRFVQIEPALFRELQRWTNRKMLDEGWAVPQQGQ